MKGIWADGPTAGLRFEDAEAQKLFASAANTEVPPDVNLSEVIRDWIRKLRCDTRRREAARLQVEIEEAQRADDMPRAFELASRRAEIELEIRQLGAA